MGLKRIVLRDFVIVDELDLDLPSAFTVLTGETGAGKSILIDAVQLVTGARADATSIREGAQRAEVSAEFDNAAQVTGWLDQAGFEPGDSLLLRRSVDLQGKSRGWINGSPATAAQLRQLGEQLIDIHGQHAWQSLTRPEAVRGLLDAYAHVDGGTLTARWHAWRQSAKALADAQATQDTLQAERDRLAWQIGELDKLAPQEGEWTELNTDHGRLSNAQALLDAAEASMEALQGHDGGAAQFLSLALQRLTQLEHLEPGFKPLTTVLASSLAEVEDAAHSLRTYLRKTELDPQRLAELDQRMASWVSLARRYKRPPQELSQLLSTWKNDLVRLDAAADLAALEAATQLARAGYMQEAKAVSRQRAKAAPLLAEAITTAMQGLGMAGGRFEVSLVARPAPQQDGLEDISFLVAGHPGTTPRPIGKVASGGELSRIALAIAVTTSELGTAQTLIFDEVDAGVGGSVAQSVGRLMRQLGRDRQVLAVTHLPQVAVCANHHLVVSKGLREGTTLSSVGPVAGDQRVLEIARMLGGDRILATTRAHATEMLQTA